MRKKTDDIPQSKKQYKWTNNYIAKAYDRVNLTMPKGEKEHIQKCLAEMREENPESEQYGSVNAFIMYAIRKAVREDTPLCSEKRCIEMNLWHNSEATADEVLLHDRMIGFNKYFSDMVFDKNSITGEAIKVRHKEFDDYAESYSDIPPELENFEIGYIRARVAKLEDGVCGMYSRDDRTITILPAYIEDDSVILHEMIHAYEDAVNKQPLFFRDALLLALYKSLSERVENLDTIIANHSHILTQYNIGEIGGMHSVVFLLKSIDLDLKMGYPVGTVFLYGNHVKEMGL